MINTLDQADFAWFCEFLRSESAIVIDATKEYLVDTRLSPLLKELKLDSLGALIAQLKKRPINTVHQKVIEAMTTNETSFFRDVHPFETLKKDVLPDIIKKRGSGPLNIWCAASSTGQEPYTIAMVIRDAFPDVASRTKILCTDINQVVLDRTKKGVYSQMEVNRGLPVQMLVKFLDRKGTEWTVKDELRRMIDARIMNLAVPWSSIPPMDIVFIRNVLIYFDMETKKDIIGRIRRSMTPDGILFLGGGETLINIDSGFDRINAGKSTIYRRNS